MNNINDNQNLKLYCLHFNECDPKKCTALKLKKFNLIKIIKRLGGKLNKAILLNPFSQNELSIKDRDTILKHGLIVIDCSWKNILHFQMVNQEMSRSLPSLMATNPINYGKWGKLSSVEALAAALYTTHFFEQARLLLLKFSWGNEFIKRNF